MASANKLPSGNWRIQVYVYDKDGNKKRVSFTAPTRWEAEKKAAECFNQVTQTNIHLTVREALLGYIALKKNVLSASTIYGYNVIVNNRLQSIMNVEIHTLNSILMQNAINQDALSVSRKSINEAKNLVVTALKLYGVRLELNVTLPPKEPKIKDLPTAQQVIKMVRGTDIELPCMLSLWLSLRISEVRGLQFQDLKDNVLTVRRSKLRIGSNDVVRELNKTYKSTRQLVIPDYLKELILAVPHENETDFIVPTHYQTITKRLKKLAQKNGYEMTFHDLRHLNASVMLMLGVPDKYAMERGGWSTPNTLKNVYQHTFSDERKQVDKKIDEFFESAMEE